MALDGMVSFELMPILKYLLRVGLTLKFHSHLPKVIKIGAPGTELEHLLEVRGVKGGDLLGCVPRTMDGVALRLGNQGSNNILT